MKIQIASDLHIEFIHDHRRRPHPDQLWHLPKTDADVIVIAGDIWYHTHAIWWVAEEAKYQGKPIIFIFGNHDFWNDDAKNRYGLLPMINEARRLAERYRQKGAEIYFLENDSVKIGNTRFLGSTLWTDYLSGNPQAMLVARFQMNDFRFIPGKPLPESIIQIHVKSVEWLNSALDKLFEGKTVVLTHHAPHVLSMDSAWEGRHLTSKRVLEDAAYYTNLEWLIDFHQPHLWIHGHTHIPVDYHVGLTRVIHNPRGYSVNDEWLKGADPEKVIEI